MVTIGADVEGALIMGHTPSVTVGTIIDPTYDERIEIAFA
jgi:hypothetical protein